MNEWEMRVFKHSCHCHSLCQWLLLTVKGHNQTKIHKLQMCKCIKYVNIKIHLHSIKKESIHVYLKTVCVYCVVLCVSVCIVCHQEKSQFY